MKLSISNIAWDSENNKKIYQLMKKYNYEGLEIAPTKVFCENPYEKLEKSKVWKEELNDKYNLRISSMQSIWYGREERLFGTDEERKKLRSYTEKAIDFASVIECKNLVFGSPKNRNLEKKENSNKALEFFKSIGEYAFKNSTVIGMEANPTIYNTNYINDTKSALELIKKVESKGFLLNLDVGTIISNNENIEDLFGNIKYINHVHISEPWLKVIKKREIHKKLKSILTNENYQGFVSIEMTKVEKLEELEKVMKYVREVFK